MTSDTIPLTPQQAAAIETRDVSIALSAGAGCGKTFVLTQRFLTHLQPECGQDALSGIVAITFTERAAREMRDRIRAACQRELQHCSESAVNHWLEVIRALDSARISTIHSFCGAVLRSNAVDANLDPRFGMLDQTTGDAFLRKTVSDSLNVLLSRQDEDCMELVLNYGLERTCDLLRNLVLQRFRIDFDDFEQFDPKSLAQYWLQRWQDEFVPLQLSNLLKSPASQRLLELLHEHRPEHAEMQRRREFLLANLPRLPDAADPRMLLENLQDHSKVQGGGGKKVWSDEDAYVQVKDGLTWLRNSIKSLLGQLDPDPDDIQDATRFSLMAARLVRQIADNYEKKKREAGVLDFDDLLLRTRNLLRDSEAVRRRAAAGIDFLLVDEFQDTDPVQADIVRALCGRELIHGKLFLVGDAKQSIYRFRRADPRVFHQLRSEIPDRGRLPLSRNFRSQPEILNFVNCVFAASIGESYEPLVPHAEQISPTPAMEFLFSSDDSEGEKENVSDRRRREADWIARRIWEFLNDQTPRIRSKNPETGQTELRPAQPGDVAILFRSLSNVYLYEDALRQYGIEYYLVGGRAFFAQQEIFDLINLCQFLDDPDDQVSLAGVLRSPFFSLTDDTLYALTFESKHLPSALRIDPPEFLPPDQRARVRHAAEVLTELRRKKDRLPLAELLNLALARTGYDAMLVNEFLGSRKLANLHKLIDMARQFNRSGLFTLKDFVQRMRDSISEQAHEELAVTHPETSNVVRLMTIHQSKGLEFPIVFVADMDWQNKGPDRTAYFHPEFGPLLRLPRVRGEKRTNLGHLMYDLQEKSEEDAEVVRLLYVATTRASDYLILSAGLSPNRKPTSPWLKLLAERFDLETGLPAVDPYLGRLSLGDVDPKNIPTIRVHHQRPEIAQHASGRSDFSLSLSDFHDEVATAMPASLPDLMRALPPDLGNRRQFSVSEIEAVCPIHSSSHDGSEPERRTPQPKDARDSNSGGDEDATELGTLVHAILERLDFRNAQQVDLDDLLRSYLISQPNGRDAPALRSAALPRLQAFLESPLPNELAGASRCFRELEFLLRWPPKSQAPVDGTIYGIIDCLYQTPDGHWKLLDYKTGHAIFEKPDDEVRAHYAIQMGVYALAARQLIGQIPKTVELVLLKKTFRRITLEITDEFVINVINRVNQAIQTLRHPTELSAS